MTNERDEFLQSTKDALAKRVGMRCSNPNCQKLTIGPGTSPEETINIGVAAHICAAAKGGPRYDAFMSPEERKSINNGIWLCQSCAKMIDSDISHYSKELIKLYVQCFDRPAFRDDIFREMSIEDFDKAIEDTIIALNTGCWRTRDGSVIERDTGKSFIHNQLWREKLDIIVCILTKMRRNLKEAKSKGYYSSEDMGENVFYQFYNDAFWEWFNSARKEILEILSSICRDAGLPEIRFQQYMYQ